MQIILLKDIDKLGRMGDVVRVKDGYGMNFLIPRKFAKRVNRRSVKFLEDEKKKRVQRLKRIKAKAEKLKARLESASCTISMQAGEDDKLFGTVTNDMIREAYSTEGIEIDRKHIQIKEHINKLGVYSAEIRLHPEVAATVKVWVVKR